MSKYISGYPLAPCINVSIDTENSMNKIHRNSFILVFHKNLIEFQNKFITFCGRLEVGEGEGEG